MWEQENIVLSAETLIFGRNVLPLWLWVLEVSNPVDSDPQSIPNNGNTMATTETEDIPQFR